MPSSSSPFDFTDKRFAAIRGEAKRTGQSPGEVFARRVAAGLGVPFEQVLACLLDEAENANGPVSQPS